MAGGGRAAEVAEPGRVACFLHVHAEVNHVDQDLNLSLRLHIASHHTKTEPGSALFGHQRRDNRVEGSFVRLKAIQMIVL